MFPLKLCSTERRPLGSGIILREEEWWLFKKQPKQCRLSSSLSAGRGRPGSLAWPMAPLPRSLLLQRSGIGPQLLQGALTPLAPALMTGKGLRVSPLEIQLLGLRRLVAHHSLSQSWPHISVASSDWCFIRQESWSLRGTKRTLSETAGEHRKGLPGQRAVLDLAGDVQPGPSQPTQVKVAKQTKGVQDSGSPVPTPPLQDLGEAGNRGVS